MFSKDSPLSALIIIPLVTILLAMFIPSTASGQVIRKAETSGIPKIYVTSGVKEGAPIYLANKRHEKNTTDKISSLKSVNKSGSAKTTATKRIYNSRPYLPKRWD